MPAGLSDKGLEGLRPLGKLRRLGLGHTRTTDAGIAVVASLKSLRSVNLDYTSIDDHALQLLKDLTLEELRLDATAVTDAGMEALASLSSLKLLNVYHTAITEKAFNQFKTAVPACRIVWDRDSGLPNRRRG